MQRREVLKLGLGTAAAVGTAAAAARSAADIAGARPGGPAASLRIATAHVELAPGVTVRSIVINGSTAGPSLRLGTAPLSLELRNDTDGTQVVYSPLLAELTTVAAHASQRVELRAPDAFAGNTALKPYYTHCSASGLMAGGMVAPGTSAPGAGVDQDYAIDQEHVLSIQHWRPEPVIRTAPYNDAVAHYRHLSFGDKVLSASEPLRVRQGERVLLHFVNINATRPVTLALPHHRFEVIALDGTPVPTPRLLDRIVVGPGEIVAARVTMDRPGRWILGATNREDRLAGLGRLVEYAGTAGRPIAADLGSAAWDYSWFGTTSVGAAAQVPPAASLLSLQAIPRLSATDPRLMDPTPQAATKRLRVVAARRYRVALTNFTRAPRAVRLLNQPVEIVSVAGRRTAGVFKDVVTLPSFTRIECEFTARTGEVTVLHDRQVTLAEVIAQTA